MRKSLLVTLTILFLVLGSAGANALDRVDLVILHTNDMHARIEPDLNNNVMGMPYIGALIQQQRALYPEVWVIDAGDTLHGRPVSDKLHGESTVRIMNLVGYDFMVPGNHDFNFGSQRLVELQEIMDFELLGANVYLDGEQLFQAYSIREVAGKTIGLFGLATADTYTTTHPDNIRGIEFKDMIETAQYYVDLLRNDYGADMVICIGHVGYGRNFPSTEITKAVSGIDLFIDGHSHTKLPEGEIHDGTLFVQTHEHAHNLGQVLIDLSGATPVMKATLIPAEEAFKLEPLAEIEEYLEEARNEVRKKLLGF